MKNLANLLIVSILAGILTLGSYKLFFEENEGKTNSMTNTFSQSSNFIPANYSNRITGTNADFTEAAEKTVHGVVHVKNITENSGSLWDYYRGNSDGKALRGAGSGVIISPDGYIVTNNHVIERASEIQVTLNNNKTYTAELIGADKKSDIALLKVEAEEELAYIPFGNSNQVNIGEWVLAVGNPFNLTSTVTAGIISAKARDLSGGSSPQSFIQTDAAINPGNSGGALVNINGELIGINTAITSQTGSYVGYAFAVPSNNARKIVEDIMEYGDVQQGILGIRGGGINANAVKKFDLATSQGVYIALVDPGSGADKAGLKEGDVIRKIDNIDINKFSDLTGYINTKRPNDEVEVKVLRGNNERTFNVTLSKHETFQIREIGLEVTNATESDLKIHSASNGVKISRTLVNEMQAEELIGMIITEINSKKVSNIQDVENIINNRNQSEPLSITFIDKNGEKQRYVWRR